MKEKMNKEITSRDVDFAKWYTDVVKKADLIAYSSVKGSIIIRPLGYALWENIQKEIDARFKETGHQNVYMPLLISESLFNKEKAHIAGFAPEVAWITQGGDKKLEERLLIRPTSEVLFCDHYKDIIKSYKDLPLLYNQWCNVLRWEKTTRPFLRGREFLWQEGHTMHANENDAKEETIRMLNIYKTFQEEILAIPTITGKKTEKEKFAGAVATYTVENMMYDGVALQNGTSHYFGQNFAKAFEIEFLDEFNQKQTPHQTSWGISTRTIGSLIMVHGDDRGLVIPPKIAPTKVAIIPIKETEEVMKVINKLVNDFKDNNITYMIDNTDKSPGFKFAEAEVKGYPIRIEIGPRDLADGKITIVCRDTLEKEQISANDNISQKVLETLDSIQNNLYQKALTRRDSMLYETEDYNEFKQIALQKPGFIKTHFCGSKDCEDNIKADTTFSSRCIIDENSKGKCIYCQKDAKYRIYWGKQY